MGEQAEYILNGDDCQYCGEYLGEGDGFPRACASCERGINPTPVKLVSNGQIMGKKLRKALTYPKSCENGMYRGCHWELAPAMFRKLEKWGFVEDVPPHNPIHKSRCVLTGKGEAALADIKAGKPVYIPIS